MGCDDSGLIVPRQSAMQGLQAIHAMVKEASHTQRAPAAVATKRGGAQQNHVCYHNYNSNYNCATMQHPHNTTFIRHNLLFPNRTCQAQASGGLTVGPWAPAPRKCSTCWPPRSRCFCQHLLPPHCHTAGSIKLTPGALAEPDHQLQLRRAAWAGALAPWACRRGAGCTAAHRGAAAPS
jgi:hypothetical protein